MAKTLEVVDGAVVTATTIDREAKTFTGCVYDASGGLVRASQRTDRNVTWTPTDPDRIDPGAPARYLDGECLYLGHLTAQYGHFLLESLARFWALEAGVAYSTVLFHPFVHPTPKPGKFSPASVSFGCFEIDLRRVSIVRKPLRVQRLVVPRALVEINNWADESQSSIYQRIVACCAAGDAVEATPRLYLSRRRYKRPRTIGRWKGYRPFSNEEEVEALFESLGFAVIHPERLDFAKQVAMYSRADVVAGYPSSSLHNAVFMKRGALVIKLGSLRTRSVANPNQRMCEELAGVRSKFVPFKGRVVDRDQRLGEIDIEQLRRRVEPLLA